MSIHDVVKAQKIKMYYIFEAPVRFWHWLIAICIVILVVTGYWIGTPLTDESGQAINHFMMGYIRMAHFITAMVFTISLLGRIYWGFVGNQYSREIFIFPFWDKKWWKALIHDIRWYLFLEKEVEECLGHPPTARIAMCFFFWLSVYMVFTGFALYGEGLGTNSWVYATFGWVIQVFGGNSLDVHSWHRLGMWVTIMFVIMHVYLTLREDIMTRQSVISTITNGYRVFKDGD